MNLIKAWKAKRKSIAADRALGGYIRLAEKIMGDDAKVAEWDACVTAANACLLSKLKYQQEFEEAIK